MSQTRAEIAAGRHQSIADGALSPHPHPRGRGLANELRPLAHQIDVPRRRRVISRPFAERGIEAAPRRCGEYPNFAAWLTISSLVRVDRQRFRTDTSSRTREAMISECRSIQCVLRAIRRLTPSPSHLRYSGVRPVHDPTHRRSRRNPEQIGTHRVVHPAPARDERVVRAGAEIGAGDDEGARGE